MSWELVADVDLVKQEEAYDLAMTFLSTFGECVETLRLEVMEGERRGPTIAKDTFEELAGFSQVLSEYCRTLLIDKNMIEIDVVLAVEHYEQARPRPGIQLYAPEHPGNTTRGRADATLAFGNRKSYRGTTRLNNGVVLTDQFVIDALKRVCETVSPKSVFLHCEETVSFPLDYHFIYHRDLAGFAEDLADIVRISKYGGAGYQDGRRYYPAALSGKTNMFGKRHPEFRAKVKLFLEQKIPKLEAVGIPTTFSSEFMTDVLLQCEDLEFFATNDGGIGMYGLPLLVGYCEDPYYVMMEQLTQNAVI
jgi:hypothetical protein